MIYTMDNVPLAAVSAASHAAAEKQGMGALHVGSPADRRPKHVRLIERVEELTEGLYRITFADGSVTRAQGDERWMRA